MSQKEGQQEAPLELNWRQRRYQLDKAKKKLTPEGVRKEKERQALAERLEEEAKAAALAELLEEARAAALAKAEAKAKARAAALAAEALALEEHTRNIAAYLQVSYPRRPPLISFSEMVDY